MLLADKPYIISIAFNGMLRSDLSEFYKSNYQENHSIHKVALTFFSPRNAFACFDEQKFKANLSFF